MAHGMCPVIVSCYVEGDFVDAGKVSNQLIWNQKEDDLGGPDLIA